MTNIRQILDSLSLEELVGQVLCYNVSPEDSGNNFEKTIQKTKMGGIFITGATGEIIQKYIQTVNRYAKIPVIVASDTEHGPEIVIKGSGELPLPMAWGACNDEKLIEKAGEQTATICRKNGVHWSFAPVVDINVNFRSPECNIRAVSDNPDAVIRIAGAYAKGLEKNGLMIAGCKHFPGQGYDERNSHFCTTENKMSKSKWMKTYGKIYKAMISQGVGSIMVGHIALPAFETEKTPTGDYLPAVLSKSLLTDLLRKELKFDGCIVSDAMSMIGVCSCIPISDIAVEFLRAGGDMILFPEENDFDNILNAVKSGYLDIERLKDAVYHVLKMKEKARLFDNQEQIISALPSYENVSAISQEIADKSIKVVRDYNGIIPNKIKQGGKILFLNMVEPYFHKEPSGNEFQYMRQEFEMYGYKVDEIYTAKHKEVKRIMGDYDMVLLNCKMSSRDYHGATLRVGWNNIMVLWRGYVLQHPNFIFVSFGDPYKLFDMPYLKEYINAFSFTESSQRAVAKVILGKIKNQGKNPIDFEPFFMREI